MKANIVLRFSSSEEDLYSSSTIDCKHQVQKKSNTRSNNAELIEISSDSDDIVLSPIIKYQENIAQNAVNKSRPPKSESFSIKPVSKFNTKINKLPIILDDDDDSYYDEDENNEINSNDQNDVNANISINTLPSSQPIPNSDDLVNDSEQAINVNSSQHDHALNIIEQPNSISAYNQAETETNSFDFNQSIINNNLLNQNSFPIYRCHRESSKGLGRQINFKFFRSDSQIMSATGKGMKHDKIAIYHNDGIISKIQSKYYRSSKKIKFDLFTEPEGNLEASIDFTHKKESLPREVSITINNPSFGLPNKCESQKPKYNKLKKLWQMNFKGKYVLRSIKNTILVDEQLNKLMYVRKTNKDDLDIDILVQIDEIFIFYFAISSFLCKL